MPKRGTIWATLAASTTATAEVASVPVIQRGTRPEAGQRPQRHLDVRVGAAGCVHAAARLGQAEHDEPHGQRAGDEGDGRGRAEQARGVRGQAEDAAARS